MNFGYNYPTPKSKYASDYESFSNKNYPNMRELKLINYHDFPSYLLNRFDSISTNEYDLSKIAQISDKLYNIESSFKLEDSNTLHEKMKKIKSIPLTSQVKQFVQKLDFDYESIERLENFLSELHQFLKEIDTNYEIKDSIFIDPDYQDWQEIKITIILNKDLDYTLKEIKPTVYKMADKMTSLANDKIIIAFKSR